MSKIMKHLPLLTALLLAPLAGLHAADEPLQPPATSRLPIPIARRVEYDRIRDSPAESPGGHGKPATALASFS